MSILLCRFKNWLTKIIQSNPNNMHAYYALPTEDQIVVGCSILNMIGYIDTPIIFNYDACNQIWFKRTINNIHLILEIDQFGGIELTVFNIKSNELTRYGSNDNSEFYNKHNNIHLISLFII